MTSIKKQLSKQPPVFWFIFYIFVLLITLPVLAYIGVISDSAPNDPPVVSTNPATGVTLDSATLSGTTSKYGVTRKGFEWGPTTEYSEHPVVDDDPIAYDFFSTLGESGRVGEGGEYHIDFDSQGNSYVTDKLNDRVVKFNTSGAYITEWDVIFDPEGIVVDSQDNVYVTSGFREIQKFDSDGNSITSWQNNGRKTAVNIYRILEIEVDSQDNIYVVDNWDNAIVTFDSDGNYIKEFGNLIAGSNNGELSSPTDIVLDNQDDIYVADYENYRIQKFDNDGNFILKWGSQGTGNGQFEEINGISLDSSGNVFVVGTDNHRIQKFDSSGTYLTQWGSQGTGDGQFNRPTGISVDSNDNIYVAEGVNDRVQVFDSNGVYSSQWTVRGEGEGWFSQPESTLYDGSDNLYVADTDNHRIQKFDSSGVFLMQWGKEGNGNGEFNKPSGIAIDGSDNLYVADTANHRIQKFDSSGTYLTQWGSQGAGDGQFNQPTDLSIDSSNNIYVVDSANHRIQKFDSSGTYLTQWGSQGTGDGQFNQNPLDIAIDDQNYVYVAASDLQKFDSNGNYIEDIITPYSFNSNVHAVEVDENFIYVAGLYQVGVTTIDNERTDIVWGAQGSGDGELDDVNDISIKSDGTVSVLEQDNERVQNFTISSDHELSYEFNGSLYCETTYHFRAYATNINGTTYGEDQVFTTDSCPEVSAPQNLVGDAFPTLAHIVWDEAVLDDHYNNGFNVLYRTEYKKSSSNDWTELDTYDEAYQPSELRSPLSLVPHLDPNTSYDFRVRTVVWRSGYGYGDTKRVSDWSDVLTVSTLVQPVFTISNCEELQAMSVDRDTLNVGNSTAKYVLTNDIDCSETSDWYWSDVPTTNPVGFRAYGFGTEEYNWGDEYHTGLFIGELDGQGYTVSNIYQSSEEQGTANGLFYFTMGATIKNITFENFVSRSSLVYSSGALVYSSFMTRIENVHMKNLDYSMTGEVADNQMMIGGLVGFDNVGETINNSSVTGSIRLENTGEPTTQGHVVGGLLGFANFESTTGRIESSFADVDIELIEMNNSIAGGLFGHFVGYLSNSYSLGSISVSGAGGVMIGGLGGQSFYSHLNSQKVYSATDINIINHSGPISIGGLYGLVANNNDVYQSSYTDSFFAGSIIGYDDQIHTHIFGGSGLPGGIFGTALGKSSDGQFDVEFSNLYYDKNKLPQNNCFSIFMNDEQEGPITSPVGACSAVNEANSEPNYFINNSSNPPLDQWDFDSLWRTEFSTFPTFVGSSMPEPENPPQNPPEPENPPVENPQLPENPVTPPGPSGPANPTTDETTDSDQDLPFQSPRIYQHDTNQPTAVLASVKSPSLLGRIVNLAEKVPEPVAKSVPYVLIIFLFLIALFYAYQTYLEVHNYRLRKALLDRLKKLQIARTNFIQLTSHHLNTPIALMSSSLELLHNQKKLSADANKTIEDNLSKLKTNMGALLTSNQNIDAPSKAVISHIEQKLQGNPYLNIRIIAPTLVVATLVVAANILFEAADRYNLTIFGIAWQLGLFIAALITLGLSYRTLKVKQQVTKDTNDVIATEQQLENKQLNFIDDAAVMLDHDVNNLEKASKDLPKDDHTQKFMVGLAQLKTIAHKFGLLKRFSISNQPTKLTNLTQLTNEVIESYQARAKESNVTLSYNISDTVQHAIDTDAYRYLLISLIDNAIKFNKPGGTVDVTLTETRQAVHFTITDTGKGISKELQDRIFEPFNRTTSTETYNFDGIGFDIYLDKTIVDAAGGIISIDSQPDKGATVRVVLGNSSI